MIITFNKNTSAKDVKEGILKLRNQIFLKRSILKKTIVNKTFGKVTFDLDKTPLEIQKEIRNEWS